MKTLFCVIAFIAVVAAQETAKYNMVADLSADQETHTVTGAGSAVGHAFATFNPSTRALTYYVTHSGSFNVTAAHIHGPAFPGANGGVLHTLSVGSLPYTGTYTLPDAAAVTDLLAGKYYFNLHTSTDASGVLRGQILTRDQSLTIATAAKEVPVVSNTFKGYGFADVTYGRFFYNIVHDVANVTNAHLHGPASASASAGALITLTSSTSTLFTGTSASSQTVLRNFADGQTYLNIHSSVFAAGAVRGQFDTQRTFVAELRGSNEVPAVTTTHSGGASFAYFPTTGTLQGTVSVDNGLSPTNIHIHGPAAAGANGGVLFTVCSSCTGKSWTVSVVLNSTILGYLQSNQLYVNVHSTAHASGELRGQIFSVLQTYSTTPPTAAVEGSARFNVAAYMDTDQETHTVTGAGGAIGFALGTYNPSTGTFSYWVAHTGSFLVTAGHVHGPAFPGATAGVASFTGATLSVANLPYSGTVSVSAGTSAASLLGGQYYLNLHTTADASGVLRGQIITANQQVNILKGSSEVPAAVNSFKGYAYSEIDGTTLTYNINHDVTNATNAHLHGPADASNNAGALVTLTKTTNTTFAGTATVTSTVAGHYSSAMAYWNVHSDGFAAGAIRGQTTSSTVFVSQLLGSYETTPAETNAVGAAMMSYDTATKTLRASVGWSNDLLATAAHIHGPAAPGANGGVIYTVCSPCNGTSSNLYQFSVVLTADQEGYLNAGTLYFNIHSVRYPNGELRGQIYRFSKASTTTSPAPRAMFSVSLLLLPLTLALWRLF